MKEIRFKDSNLTEICSQESSWQFSIANGLVAWRRRGGVGWGVGGLGVGVGGGGMSYELKYMHIWDYVSTQKFMIWLSDSTKAWA